MAVLLNNIENACLFTVLSKRIPQGRSDPPIHSDNLHPVACWSEDREHSLYAFCQIQVGGVKVVAALSVRPSPPSQKVPLVLKSQPRGLRQNHRRADPIHRID